MLRCTAQAADQGQHPVPGGQVHFMHDWAGKHVYDLIRPGPKRPPPARLARDYSGKQAANLRVEMTTNPPNPIAGEPTQLRFSLSPGTGIERLLGAWAHMLAASDDLIDMMHEHPSLADGSPEMQFTLIFPRSRMYRVWVQFQRDGVVNTAHFDVPVAVEHPYRGVS